MSVGAGGGLLAAVRSGRVCRPCSLWAAGSSARRWRCCWCRSASGWRCGLAGCWWGHRPGRAVTDPHRSGRRSGAAGRQQGQRREDGQKKKGQGRRRGVRCCSGLWSALAAMVPAGCVPVPVVGLICWRYRWAWSALAPFPLSAFQRHGWRWRCSIRVNFAVCRRGQILHLTGLRGRCRALT